MNVAILQTMHCPVDMKTVSPHDPHLLPVFFGTALTPWGAKKLDKIMLVDKNAWSEKIILNANSKWKCDISL